MALTNITLNGAGSTTYLYEVFTPQVGKNPAVLNYKNSGPVMGFSRLSMVQVRKAPNKSYVVELQMAFRVPKTGPDGSITYPTSNTNIRIQLPDEFVAADREAIILQLASLLGNSQVKAAVQDVKSFA